MTFNLVDEPWLLAQPASGPPREVGLRDLLTDASAYRCLLGDIPTQVFPQLRLLLAIMHRAVRGPADVDAWAALWEAGTLPAEAIRAYLERHHDRFDLLHPETPFYQVAGLRTDRGEVFGLERLIADVPSGERFFTTREATGLDRIPLAEAARWLVHCHAYDASGIKSGAADDPRTKNGKGYAIGVGQCGYLGGLYVEGRDLAETLLLNLIPLDRFRQRSSRLDVPVWERAPHTGAEEPVPPGETRPYGPLDLYTWQSRRIRLVCEDGYATRVLVCNGDKYLQQNRHDVEPMSAWRRSLAQEKKAGTAVFMPRAHVPARAMWRSLESLLPSAIPANEERGMAPLLLDWLVVAEDEGGLDLGYRMRLRASGIEYGTQSAVVTELVDDTLTMPVAVLIDTDAKGALRRLVRDAIAAAEHAVRAFGWFACNLERAAGGNPAAGNTAKDHAWESAYAALDPAFRTWIAALTPEVDTAAVRRDWERTVRTTVDREAAVAITATTPKAWTGRDVDGAHLDASLAELRFRAALRKAVPLAYEAAPKEAPPS